MARLGDICTINMGQSPESSSYNEREEGLPFFQGNADFGEVSPTVRIWCNAPTKIANEGDILLSVRAPIGALNIADRQCCIGRGLAALTANEKKCSRRYLWYALNSKIEELNSKGTGSTFKAIGKKILFETEIPLPALSEQTEILQKLDAVDKLLMWRKQQLSKLDQLVKARFVEMFGDPVQNSMAWPQVPAQNVCTKITDGEHNSVPRTQVGFMFLNAKHIKKSGEIDWASSTYVSEEDHRRIYSRCNPEQNDILLTTTGTIGNVAIVSETTPFSMDRGVTLLKLNKNLIEHHFIAYLLRFESMQKIMLQSVRAATIGHLFLKQVMILPIITPPLPLQEEFAAFVQKVDKSKSTVKQSLEKLETLKKSLMQEYFG